MLTKESNLILSIAVFLCIVIVDMFFKTTFMSWSIGLTKTMYSWPKILYYWYWIYAGPIFVVIPIIGHLCLFILKDKSHALIIYLIVASENTISNLLKILYHDSRPCFIDEEIAAIKCTCSFGKPSGHSSSSIVMYVTLYYLLVYCNDRLSKRLKSTGLIVTIFILLNVGASRIYFGAHFVNQVFIGWALGYLILSTFYYLHERGTFVTMVFTYQDNIDKRNNILTSIIVIFTILQLLLLLSWYLVRNYFEDNPYHSFNKTSCLDKCFNEKGFLSDICIIAAGFYSSVIYLFVGFRMQKSAISVLNPLYYKMAYIYISTVLKRYTVFVVVGLPLSLGYLFARQKGFLSWLMINFGTLLFALLFILAMKPLLKSMDVLVPGDYFENLIKDTSEEFEFKEMEP